MMLVCDGKRNKEIASELGISESTVKNILRTVMDKMDVSSMTVIVIKYYKNLIEQEKEECERGCYINTFSSYHMVRLLRLWQS